MNAVANEADARVQAARVLARVLEGHALDAALPAADAALPDARDRGLLRAICFATLRGIHRYEALLAALLARQGSRLDPLLRAALLAGLAQLDTQITPPYAAVSGTVAAVRALGRPRLAALANAVLRRYQRESVALLAALPDDALQRWQHPRWLLERLQHDWPQDWQRVLEANNAPAPMILRVNRTRSVTDPTTRQAHSGPVGPEPMAGEPRQGRLPDNGSLPQAGPWFDSGAARLRSPRTGEGLRSTETVAVRTAAGPESIDAELAATMRQAHPVPVHPERRAAGPESKDAELAASGPVAHSRDEYLALLAAAGIGAHAHAQLPDAIVLDSACDVHSLPGFDAGLVSVQDGAAQLAAELLDLQPGLRVLDACAAPGGKSAHLLEREPGLKLLALDESPTRAARIDETLARLGLRARVRAADATHPSTWWDGTPFDRILIDAPCSGTGVIRRHPDIRLLRRDSDLAGMTALQDRLLAALWPLLAPGGRLVYATCSVLADENARRIADFLARTPDARALDVVPAWFGAASGAGRQHLPGDEGLDGFFYAVLAHAG